MACLPLVERELRVALRKQRPARGRFKVAVLAVGGSVLFLLVGALADTRSQGRTLEQYLCLAGLYFILRTPLLTAGVLAEERRNQTLGLLFLSGLGAGEVFVSKFLSAALIAFTNLLALFPMLALPFLLGGVSFDLFLAIVCALPVLMLFALAMSLLASVLTREDGAAVVLAIVLGALLCVVAPEIYRAQVFFSPGARPSLWWWRLSPAYGPQLIWNGFITGFRASERAEFWPNLAVTLGWSALALGAAAFALKRLWRQQETEVESSGWGGRWHELVHGKRETRQRLARTWLDVNPFVWLAGRDRQPATLGWAVVGGVVLVWLLCWAAWPARWPSVQNFFFTAALLNFALAWLIRHTAAQAVGQGRQDGAYELLLTTPLNPSDIVWGTLEALRWHFRALTNCVLAVDLVMMLGGLVTRRWNAAALVVYSSTWLVLLVWTWSLGRRWSGVLAVMWASLNCGRPARAVWRASRFNGWTWIWLLCCLNYLGRAFRRFPTGSPGELLFIQVGVVGWLIWVSRRTSTQATRVRELRWNPQSRDWVKGDAGIGETRLVREFREIVREPLPDPSDPRFKKWDARERFPWGWELVQQQLHERLARR
jgi:ABC-type transport system involved in multi-copper enzyme maturation permease subunit